eukprot:scaffold7821_cov27-Phaeocystis_antarctica.AAC.2
MRPRCGVDATVARRHSAARRVEHFDLAKIRHPSAPQTSETKGEINKHRAQGTHSRSRSLPASSPAPRESPQRHAPRRPSRAPLKP